MVACPNILWEKTENNILIKFGYTEINLPVIPDTLATANDTLSKAIQELRSLSRSLDKEWLEQFNLLENLENEIARINAGGVIKCDFTCAASIDMKADEQLILFRIVQEAMQNALRHANPKTMNVNISQNETWLQVKVVNDGRPLESNFHGMGTNNMRHRANLFGGKISWQPLEKGTEVTILLPSKNGNENQDRIGG